MTAGDYLVRNNSSNTDEVVDAGSDLLLLWDNEVASVGSGITYSSGTFTLGETGKFLVIASDQYGTTDTTNNERINAKTTFTLGSTELQEGFSTGYIRKSNGSQEFINFSAAIIDITSTAGTADELQVRTERIDNSSAGTVNRIADRSGITILKLDDTWGYGRYESSAAFTPSATDNTFNTADISSTLEEDSPFTRTGDVVDIATTNLVLAVYSFKNDDTDTLAGRTEFQGCLELAGSVVPGSFSQTYGPRVTDNCDWGGMSGLALLEPSSGDDLELQFVSREGADEDWFASLQLVELPVGAEAIIVEATTGDFNASATNFAWDTAPRPETGAFTHTTGQANIDVDNAGDYLALASQAVLSMATATRAVPALSFRVNTTDYDFGNSAFNRNSGTTGWASLNSAALLTGLSASDSVYARNDRIGTASTAITNASGGMSVIRLSSLFSPSTDPTITDVEGDEDFKDKDTAVTLTGTNYEATQGTGKVELGSAATYGASTLVTQTVTSWADTSIDITAVLSTLTPGSLWLYITNDTGDVSAGFPVTVHRADAFAMSLSSNFTDGDATTAQLTSPGGSFVAGEMNETSNPAASINITEDDYTEVEWCIEATTDAEDAGVYLFRVTDNGTVLDTYTVTPQWTIGSDTEDDLLADDVESASEVSAPSLNQAHALLADDTQSTSEVGTPALTQSHILTAASVESSSEVTTPAVSESHVLLANDTESSSEVTTPTLSQSHILLSNNAESASEVTVPNIAQVHQLTPNNAESNSEVTNPVLSASGEDDLLADNVESSSEVSVPALAQVHQLLADNAESNSEVTNPVLLSSGSHNLLADDAESTSEVSTPAIGQVHQLLSGNAESNSEVSAPTLAQAHTITANNTESNSEVTAPTLNQKHALLANDIESTSELTTPGLDNIIVFPQGNKMVVEYNNRSMCATIEDSSMVAEYNKKEMTAINKEYRMTAEYKTRKMII